MPYRKYGTFTGRASRKEFWLYVLFNFGVLLLLSILNNLFGISQALRSIGIDGIGTVMLVFFAAGFVPGLAVTARRLHDTSHSGFWLFIYFVPVIGAIWLLALLAATGDYGRNKYGPDPREPKTQVPEDVLDFGETQH